MKLETSETIRDDVKAEAWRVLEQGGAPLSHRALAERALQCLRDIDTLLAEVERMSRLFKTPQVDKIASLYARIDELTADRAPPLPAEVEEMRAALNASVMNLLASGLQYACLEDAINVERNALALLSRWPGLTLISDVPEGVTLDANSGAALEQKESTG